MIRRIFLTVLLGVPLYLLGGYLPLLPSALNRLGVAMVAAGAPGPAAWVFSYLPGFGNADALNNLGVLYHLGHSVPRDTARASDLYFEAIKGGHHVQAAHNLAALLPSDHKAQDQHVKRQIDLLSRNVEAGDVHSAALLATRLFHVNRQKFVPDREAKKLVLWEIAARTGDTDYRLRYADELRSQGWCDKSRATTQELEACRERIDRAWTILGELHVEGDVRATHALAYIAWQTHPDLKSPTVAAADEFVLWQQAADRGYLAAACQLGNRLTWQVKTGKTEGVDDATLVKALPYLERCAEANDKSRSKAAATERIVVPFGSPALYAARPRAARDGISNHPLTANLTLGRMYRAGLGVAKDERRAERFLRRAAEVFQSAEARGLLAQQIPVP